MDSRDSLKAAELQFLAVLSRLPRRAIKKSSSSRLQLKMSISKSGPASPRWHILMDQF